MKRFNFRITAYVILILLISNYISLGNNKDSSNLMIGWASADITPEEDVILTGGSRARISKGVMDPLNAWVLLIESIPANGKSDVAIMVSLDLLYVSDEIKSRVFEMLKQSVPDINTEKIILNGTHTHSAPEIALSPEIAELHSKNGLNIPLDWSMWGIDMGVMSPGRYIDFAAGRITGAVKQAWNNRKPGGISYGLAHASVGHNRLTSYYDGSSQMYGKINDPNFSHVEGYEDSSLGLLYTWNENKKLTGVVINIAVPSQAGGDDGKISADYWHETRLELRRRLGDELFILAQCSAAGDQSPAIMIDSRAEERMRKLNNQSRREQIADRIADAVTSILPLMEKNIEWSPILKHNMEYVELSRRLLSEEDIKVPRGTHHSPVVESVEDRFNRLMGEFQKMYKEFENSPELKKKPNWYNDISGAQWLLTRAWNTLERYKIQKDQPKTPVEVHVVRIGDMVIATNPFELYIDFGMQIKARSKAVQTFLVELANSSEGYLPTMRSVKGGAYGAIPESTQIGPEGGRELVDNTVRLIDSLWDE